MTVDLPSEVSPTFADFVMQCMSQQEEELLSPTMPNTRRDTPSPHRITLRPPPPGAMVRASPTLLSPPLVEGVLEDPIPSEEMEAEVTHISHISCTVLQFVWSCAGLDLRQDQPYMPFPCTTLREALRHLRVNKRVGLHGGDIRLQRGKVVLRTHRPFGKNGKCHYELGYFDILHLLRANYPTRYRVPCTRVA